MEFGLGAQVPQKFSTMLTDHVTLPTSHSGAVDTGARMREEQECAASVVNQLLNRAGLSRMLDSQTLKVVVGKGNWISFSFQMQRGADHSSLDVSKTLRRSSGKPQQGKSLKSSWFRSEGLPSLHFEVIPAERLGEILVQGHVDAADPKRHPVAHLFQDYLPAHGIGTHPSAEKLLATLASNAIE
jgi:hypothetical protein